MLLLSLLSQEGRDRCQALNVISEDLEGGKEGHRQEGARDPQSSHQNSTPTSTATGLSLRRWP